MPSYATVYRNRAADEFSVQPLGLHVDGYIIEAGKPTRIAASRFDDLIVPAVEAALGSFKIQSEPSDARLLSDEEYDRFRKDNDSVTVLRTDKGRYEVVPSKRVSGGYRSLEAKRVSLSRKASARELVKALKTAFEQCGE